MANSNNVTPTHMIIALIIVFLVFIPMLCVIAFPDNKAVDFLFKESRIFIFYIASFGIFFSILKYLDKNSKFRKSFFNKPIRKDQSKTPDK